MYLSSNKTTCEYIKPDNVKKISNLNVIYNSLLIKKNWRKTPKKELLKVYSEIKKYSRITKKDLLYNIDISLGKSITTTNIRKAISILMKSNVLVGKNIDTQIGVGETLWGINSNINTVSHVLLAHDAALVARLINACMEDKISFNKEVVQEFFYSECEHDLDLVVELAREKRRSNLLVTQ